MNCLRVVAVLAVALSAPTLVAGGSRRFSTSSTAVITIKSTDASIFGTNAADRGWGAALDGESAFRPIFYTTEWLTDPFGCTPPNQLGANESSFTLPAANQSFMLLVDRGRCTFTEKALVAQQLGAVGVIITDTPQQAFNRTIQANATDMTKAIEFNCKNGKSDAPTGVDLSDFTASGWDSAVNVKRCTSASGCESDQCIPSGKGQQVCCLWDIAESMDFVNTTGAEEASAITITVVRITIADGKLLKTMIADANTNTDEGVMVTINQRHPPSMDPSQFIIWLMAIITVMVGGYKGATLERERATRKQSVAAATNTDFSPRSVATNGVGANANNRTESVRTGHTALDPAANLEEELLLAADDDTMDLTMYHAISFVVFATVFLLVLFYWNVVIVVIIMFAIGSVSCSYYILWQPFYQRAGFLHLKPFVSKTPTSWLANLEPQTWTVADMFAFVTSLAISLVWFVFRSRHYAWVLQDVFGVCLCVLFLRTIRMPNLKIASVMLVLVFVYDVFMVFISPYIFKESVMIKAATGGNQGEPTASAGYCLRYPSDTTYNCQREQMPILLRFPKVIDWRGGQSMLGLGDIVMPGLLIVFCARFDYATRGQLLGRVKAPHLVRFKSTNHLEVPPSNTNDGMEGSQHHHHHQQQHQLPELTAHGVSPASQRGLFGILMWGYAIGLLAANIGVAVMKQGQPALMYLVPTTLGTLVLVAWRRGILKKLWDGPEEFKAGRARALTTGTRERGFTVDHVIETSEDHHHHDGVVMIASEATPQSTYARTEDSPRRQPL